MSDSRTHTDKAQALLDTHQNSAEHIQKHAHIRMERSAAIQAAGSSSTAHNQGRHLMTL